MSIAVLITCHNRKHATIACLKRLLMQIGGNDAVFVVDDGSTDGTYDAILDIGDRRIVVIRGDGALYWGKGMRLAWETAEATCRYDFYVWLNDDLLLKKDAIESLLADGRSVKGVVVGVCSGDSSEMSVSYGATDKHDNLLKPIGRPQLANGWFNGNFVLIPRAVYESVGMISGKYTHARADYDYAERLKLRDIPFYCSSDYVGSCRNDFVDKVKHLGLWSRVKLLWQPGYFNLHDLWRIRRKYHGICRAIVSCVHMIFIVLKGWR